MSSLTISNITFHQLVRKSETEIDLILRDSDATVNQPILDLVSDIRKIYDKKQKAFGLFNDGSLFAPLLQDLLNNDCDFIHFSAIATKQLRNELAKYPFMDGGTVVFCRYQYLAVDYLFIAVINSCNSALISDKLDIEITQYLDIQHADIMAQINLTEWQTEPDSVRYLSFIKGRVGRKISDFFMDFLGASEGMNTRALNRALIQAVEGYCTELKLDKNEKQTVRDHVYSYCNVQAELGEEVNLSHLSRELPESNDTSNNFEKFVNNQEYDLDKEFPVDKSVIKLLKKYVGAGGGLSISFDACLLGERIIWDPITDTIVIKGTPPNLRDQLQRKGMED